jgi:hypothetical protein
MVPHGGWQGAMHLALPAMTFCGPWTMAPLDWPQEGTGLMCGLRVRVMEHVASSAVSRLPLLKRTPLRRWKVQTLRSELIVGGCAARPSSGRSNSRSGRDHHGTLHVTTTVPLMEG